MDKLGRDRETTLHVERLMQIDASNLSDVCLYASHSEIQTVNTRIYTWSYVAPVSSFRLVCGLYVTTQSPMHLI